SVRYCDRMIAKTAIVAAGCLLASSAVTTIDASMLKKETIVQTTGKLSAYSFDGVYRHFEMRGVEHFCGPKRQNIAVIKLRDTNLDPSKQQKQHQDQQLRNAYYAGVTVTISSVRSKEDFDECKILSVQVYHRGHGISLK
ncbi:MAG: hypothetical protein MJK04_33135, partial [Psychrosphaera sp.]|nr:hypothetical protein [Psychrosphaera sp.]